MFSAIRRYNVPEKSIQEVLDKTEKQGFLSGLEQIPGFFDYYYVYSEGKVMTIGIFESRAGAEQSHKFAADWVPRNLSGLYAGPPETFVGEVKLHRPSKTRKAA